MMTIVFLLLLLLLGPATPDKSDKSDVPKTDRLLLEFPLNLEYLEAEFFLYGAMGKGLDHIQPNLTGGGPRPIGVRRANLSPLVRDLVTQFGYQEVGHIREIKSKIPGFARPLLDLSPLSFAKIINKAFKKPLIPMFDPYANDINYMIASYIIPYVGLTGYVGASPKLRSSMAKKLVAGLLAVESGQDAVVRSFLFERALIRVIPYGISVAEFTNRISELRNSLGDDGIKDQGLFAKAHHKGKGKMSGHVLAGNKNALAYGRTPEEILRIVYGSGKEKVPGGFYPKGANGTIAKKYLKGKDLF